MATIHNEATIKGKVTADIPVAPALLWKLVSVLWKSVNDAVLQLLLFLVSLGMLVQIL